MCNLYANTMAQEAMRRLFKAEDFLGNQPPLPAIFPDQEAPIVVADGNGRRALIRARWGWSRAPFGWVTNIRNLEKWPWREAIKKHDQRCLIPATSFVEYHPTQRDPKGRKAAVWFRLADADPNRREPFAFAGLKRTWSFKTEGLRRKSDGARSDTAEAPCFAFLTCAPNSIVEPIHPKAMPVILTREKWDHWLNAPADEAVAMQQPLPDDQLDIAFVRPKEDPVDGTPSHEVERAAEVQPRLF